MKAHDLIPGIVGGIAFYSVYKFGTDDAASMTLMGFAVAFLICCHNGQAVTLRAVIMGGLVFLFASGSYQVGKKCKPATPKITQGQS
jgi:hypothetical protein